MPRLGLLIALALSLVLGTAAQGAIAGHDRPSVVARTQWAAAAAFLRAPLSLCSAPAACRGGSQRGKCSCFRHFLLAQPLPSCIALALALPPNPLADQGN